MFKKVVQEPVSNERWDITVFYRVLGKNNKLLGTGAITVPDTTPVTAAEDAHTAWLIKNAGQDIVEKYSAFESMDWVYERYYPLY